MSTCYSLVKFSITIGKNTDSVAKLPGMLHVSSIYSLWELSKFISPLNASITSAIKLGCKWFPVVDNLLAYSLYPAYLSALSSLM